MAVVCHDSPDGSNRLKSNCTTTRLLESFRLGELTAAVDDALRLGAIGFDAVKHLVLCRIERRPPRLNLEVYPYLPRARVATTSAKSYRSLLPGLRA